MQIFNVSNEMQGEVDALIRKAEAELSSILGRDVDVTFLVHPQHGDGERCQGTAIMTLQHPMAAYTSIVYAGLTMQRVLQDMEEAGNATLN